jgi:isopenicillin-N epimerase
VLQAIHRLREEQAANPSHFLWRRSGPLLDRARARLADYVNCDAGDLLLLPNNTFAMNIVVNSLNPPPGTEVLSSDHEYGAMMYCWRRAAEREGWTIRQLTLPYRSEDPSELIDAFADAIGPHTRIVYFSHVTTSTGLVLPARELASLAKQRGLICVIDGAHAPGMVPVDLSGIDADFYTANCHKWMMCPAGAGFLHVRHEHRPLVKPLITSWGWEYDRSQPDAPCEMGGTKWQWNLEFHGTVDRCTQMVIPEALEFRDELGGEQAIERRVRELADYARRRMSDAGFAPVTPANPLLSGAIVAFDFPADPLVRERFWNEFHIECPITVAAGRTFLRVSTAWFVTHQQIDRLAEAALSIRR